MAMPAGQDAVFAAHAGIAAHLRRLHIQRPRAFRVGLVGAIVLVVVLVVSVAYALGSAQRAARVDGELLALNSEGENVTQLQNQTVGAYNTDVKVVRQASTGWTGTLLTSLVPLTDPSTVATLRADVTELLSDARPIAPASWKSLSSPGADVSAVAAARARVARAKADNRAATAAATTLGRAQSALLVDLKALAASMRGTQSAVLATNASAPWSAQQAFVSAEQAAVSEMTAPNAQAVVAAYDVLGGGSPSQPAAAGTQPNTPGQPATPGTQPTGGADATVAGSASPGQ